MMQSQPLAPASPNLNARQAALRVLNILGKKTIPLDLLLSDFDFSGSASAEAERALLNALVYGVLRWRGRLDWIIAHFSKTRLNRIDPDILNILRIGLFQAIMLDKIPVSAAVNTSVEMAKTFAAPWVVRYVNGLLRNAVRNYSQVVFPDLGKMSAKSLAVNFSFPEWLIKRWLNRYGADTTKSLCEIINTIPPLILRTNTLKNSRSELIQLLMGLSKKIKPASLAPDGIIIEQLSMPIFQLPGFSKGCFQVQDEAAQLAVLLLNPQPGEIILDACAGLGGKTGYIAQLMKNRGQIYAIDNQPLKLEKLTQEMQRLGVSIIRPLIKDLTMQEKSCKLPSFDRIFLDSPCSGLGVISKNQDIPWAHGKKHFATYRKKQITLLNNMPGYLKTGGNIVYAVCSFEPEENEQVVDAFLANHPDFSVSKQSHGLPDQSVGLVNKKGYFKAMPFPDNMDGFFAVVLKHRHC